MMSGARLLAVALALSGVLSVGCSSDEAAPAKTPAPTELDWPCEIADGAEAPDYLEQTGCRADFQALASKPLDASIPGARSGKVILDLLDGDKLYFQNSVKYPIHYEFAKAYLDDPMSALLHIGSIGEFNPQYTLPLAQRRFLLGAVSYYEQPNVWALEIAPYDTSTPQMIEKLFEAVRDNAFYGPVLEFHPTSESVQEQAGASSLPVETTDELYANIDYQPLNLGVAIGPIKFIDAADLGTVYVTSRDIVVLDEVPNDITPVNGIITEQFQTPLSHINVLARNRGTPNMGLRHARDNPQLRNLANGQQVRLTVSAFEFEVEPVTVEESNAWWDAHLPPPVSVPEPDLSVKDLRDIEEVTDHTDESPYVELDAIQAATRAFGAKAANYSVFSTDPRVPSKKAFAIPVYYYDQFMRRNGFFDRVAELREDPEFRSNDQVRDEALASLRNDILLGEVSEEFRSALGEKLTTDYPGLSMRFRSSTNAEDLDGFPCAGCYDSHTGDPDDYDGDQVAAAIDAIRETFATVWSLRTYDERELHGIDHTHVAMALLVHTNFPDEEANGVAITDNIFDQSGNSPGFYVNVQEGGTYEVVHPPSGITSDSFLFLYSFSNQPIIYYTHSNITVPVGSHVLTVEQIHALGDALSAIDDRFRKAFGTTNGGWWAMDTEFKFDDEADTHAPATLYIKQARPYPKGGD